MMISDTMADVVYHDPALLVRGLADARNGQVPALARAGWGYVQVDEISIEDAHRYNPAELLGGSRRRV